MTHTTTGTGASAAPLSLPARFIGIITSPRDTFASIAAYPKWLGMLAVLIVLSAFFTVLPMTTEQGRQAALDQQVQTIESFSGQPVDDAMYERLRRQMAIAPYTTAGSIVVLTPVMLLIIAGILFAIFNAAMAGDASFKQLYAVVVHAGVISTLGAMFTGPLNYFRGAMGSATNLAVLLPMIDEKSFAGRLLGMIDLFIIWWLVVLAIGLAVLYRRRTQPIAMTLLGVYAVIAIGLAALFSSLGG